jgi:hypothetical protein
MLRRLRFLVGDIGLRRGSQLHDNNVLQITYFASLKVIFCRPAFASLKKNILQNRNFFLSCNNFHPQNGCIFNNRYNFSKKV